MTAVTLESRRVRDIMTTHAVALAPDDTVADALAALLENRFSSLPVVDQRSRCVGVISAMDVLDLAREQGVEIEALHETDGLTRELLVEHFDRADFSDKVVQEVMTPAAVEIFPDATIVEAAKSMIRNHVHHLVVTEGRHRFTGVVSTMDVLRAVVEAGGNGQ